MDKNNILYKCGYIITDDCNIQNKLGNIGITDWKQCSIGKFFLFVHPDQKFYKLVSKNIYYIIIGHAYNPFTLEYDENEILNSLSSAYKSNRYQEYFNQLTGMFAYFVFDGETIIANTDCAGMYPTYYSIFNNILYYSSYSQLIADTCNLKESTYCRSLKCSKLFHLYGWFLPGDLSPYDEVKRLIANTEVIYTKERFVLRRFYPEKKYSILQDSEYEDAIDQIGKIIHNNLLLILKKWKHPAISLTGGMDSQTTLACASDAQDRFEYYSYISLPREATDAEAARKICEKKGLKHTIFRIETNKDKLEDFDLLDSLIERHYSYLGKGNENDVCKRISLIKEFNYDVEVKSWVSEVGRASRYKMYGRKEMPKLTSRCLTTMYKVFTINRRMALETDKRFEEYLEKTELKNALSRFQYPWSEFFVWEIVFGGWGSLALTGEHRLSNDITIPYNNRALLDLMLRMPLEKRITDNLNRDIIKRMDKQLYEMNIHVVNGNETKSREIAEKFYFQIHSKVPF